jgi:hypothetical protein
MTQTLHAQMNKMKFLKKETIKSHMETNENWNEMACPLTSLILD